MKLTIDEYSKQYKMSKEMIHSKIKMKKIDYIIEDSITYIMVDSLPLNDKKDINNTLKNQTTIKPKTTVSTVIALYQRENVQLKEKIMQLELKIDRLIDDKEQMLREERNKIEQLYNKKDEQLKNILELVNAKMMLEKQNQTIHEVQTLEQKEQKQEPIELRTYLKTLNLKTYQKKIIKKRFISTYDSDIRIIQKNGKLYLDFEKYDYSDLLAY